MKLNHQSFYWLLAILWISNFAFSQYSISGYLNSQEKEKIIYLSILRYNERMTVYENQVITYTKSDSLGFFSFEGKLLSEKNALYRIHAEIEDGFGPQQIHDDAEFKNLHNFIFSNNDTIVFQKNKKYWFADNINTNPIDQELRDFDDFGKKMQLELYALSDSTIKKKSSIQYLNEIKSYANSKDVHPLVTLILISDVDVHILKQDIEEDSDFYNNFQQELNAIYDNEMYAAQFEELLTDLSKNDTQKQLKSVKKLNYVLFVICFLFLTIIIYLLYKLKQAKAETYTQENVHLTNQEKRIAELIVMEKSNKEIADELFISLSTVKTHIRNLYAKMEVSKRQELIEKIGNQPRD